MTPAQELRRGWPVLLAAFCGITTGVLTFPFNLIGPQMRPIRAEFGWSSTALSLCSSCIGAGLVIGSPIAGRLADKISARVLALVSMTMLATILALLSRIGPAITPLYLAYFLMGLLCAGSGIATYTRPLGGWFRSSRGLAIGIALAGTGVAVFITPIIANFIEQRFGWRAVYVGIAALVVAAMPFIAFGLREPPPDARDHVDAGREGDEKFHWRAVWRDPHFFLLALALGLLGIVMSGTTLRIVPMLLDEGYSHAAAAGTASMLGLALIAGRVGMGWLVDRYPAPRLGVLSFLTAAAGCAVFVAQGPSAALFPIVGIGLLWGAEYDLVSFMVMRYFGLARYGGIYGTLFSIYVLFGFSSPLLMGLLIERGGYGMLFLVNALVFAAIAAVFGVLAAIREPAGDARAAA